jgi:thioredoxin 1
MSQLPRVNDQNFETEVLKSTVPVLVDFYATWCGPCKSLTPILEQIAGDYQGKVKIVKLDIDEASVTASAFGIMGVPTMILFKGGRELNKLVGLKPRAVIESALKQAM